MAEVDTARNPSMLASAATTPTPIEAAATDRAEGLQSLLYARAYLFALFAKALATAPDSQVVDALFGEDAREMASLYARDCDTMRGLGEFLRRQATRDRADLLDAARDEYTRLFIGPAGLLASPFESPYLTHDLALVQENTLVVRAAYRAFGVEPAKLHRIPDDHVAFMVGFMALRARRALELFEAGDAAALGGELRDEQVFVVGHMGSWLSEFAYALRKCPVAVLYPQLLEALSEFAALDATFLGEAAYWAEGIAAVCDDANFLAGVPGVGVRAKAALSALDDLRPVGYDDFSFVAVCEHSRGCAA